MNCCRLALIGFGNVGQGLAHILHQRSTQLAQQFGLDLQIVAVSTLNKGGVYDPQGLDPAALLAAVQQPRGPQPLSAVPAPHYGWDALRTIAQSNADIVLELSYTDLQTGEPALTHVREALRQGKHVVTANKGPAALHLPQLRRLAQENGVELGVEGTVMSGTPALRLGTELLAGAGIRRLQGVLNGTTNYILTQMESGATFEAALAEAQARGYAEADPTGDVEGHDAAAKLVILANLLLDLPLTPADVPCTGITALTPQDIRAAQAAGERWKLIGVVARTAHGYEAGVQPVRLPLSHPLASVSGATNAITYTTDLLGDLTLVGPGAGRIETGYALLADVLALARRAATSRRPAA